MKVHEVKMYKNYPTDAVNNYAEKIKNLKRKFESKILCRQEILQKKLAWV